MPPWFRNIFKFVVFRLLENAFVSKKIEDIFTRAILHSYTHTRALKLKFLNRFNMVIFF